MTRLGLLLTMTEPPAGMEEEFNAWYDTEHLAERLAIPGFRSATRWVADVAPGEGRYLATYELDSLQVLSSADYLARFQNQTPWSLRCLGKAVVFKGDLFSSEDMRIEGRIEGTVDVRDHDLTIGPDANIKADILIIGAGLAGAAAAGTAGVVGAGCACAAGATPP